MPNANLMPMALAPNHATRTIQLVGGPTVLLEIGGLRLLTDPTLDLPGHYDQRGMVSEKTIAPALSVAELGRIDAVLLSHDEHFDNLDTAGRRLLQDVGLTLTTPEGEERLGGTAQGLAPFESTELERPDGGTVTVTAVPARHGPEGVEPVLGQVTGFWLAAEDVGAVYVTGDNASLDHVREIGHRLGSPDLIVQFVGAVHNPEWFDGQLLTMDGVGAQVTATLLGARAVAIAHAEGWTHYSQGRDEAVDAFTAAGLADRLLDTPVGDVVTF